MTRKILHVIFVALLTLGCRVEAREITYYYVDAQGSVLATTDEHGSVVSMSEYRPYGTHALGIADGVGYTSHVHDDDDLIYMQARYYDSALGRFLSVDPRAASAGELHSFSRYGYGNGNPYRFIDPDGQAPRLLGDLKLMTKDIVDSGNRLMVEIVGVFNDRATQTEVSVTAAANVPLVGVEASKNVINGSDSLAVTTASSKVGFEASITAKMQMFTIDLSPDTPTSRVNYAAQVAYFELLGGGAEIKYNAGHKLTFSIIAGLGGGGRANAFQRSVDLNDPEVAKAQAAHQREQEIRELMGIGSERSDPYR